jgi:Flp pilus assembly CpaF family ATPase
MPQHLSEPFQAVAAALTVTHQNEQHLCLEAKPRRELGESILRLLVDEDVEDILLNPDSSLWVKRRGVGFVRTGALSPAAASALGTVAAWRGTVLNHDHPILETELPLSGSRYSPSGCSRRRSLRSTTMRRSEY